MASPRRLTRAMVFRVYGVFALLLVAGVTFIELCESRDAHELEVQARSWDAANNRWASGYDYLADAKVDARLRQARVGFALAVVAAAIASSVVSALYVRHGLAYGAASIAFAAFAIALALALLAASALGGAGMIGAMVPTGAGGQA